MIGSLEKYRKNEENFGRSGCKGMAGCQKWMKDKKLHLLRVWESCTGSLRNNCEEVFRAARVEISNQFCTTQSQRMLS